MLVMINTNVRIFLLNLIYKDGVYCCEEDEEEEEEEVSGEGVPATVILFRHD